MSWKVVADSVLVPAAWLLHGKAAASPQFSVSSSVPHRPVGAQRSSVQPMLALLVHSGIELSATSTPGFCACLPGRAGGLVAADKGVLPAQLELADGRLRQRPEQIHVPAVGLDRPRLVRRLLKLLTAPVLARVMPSQ